MAPTRFSSGPSLWSLSRYLRWDTRLAYTGMYPIPSVCQHAQPSTPNAEGNLKNQPEISVRRSTAKSADRYNGGNADGAPASPADAIAEDHGQHQCDRVGVLDCRACLQERETLARWRPAGALGGVGAPGCGEAVSPSPGIQTDSGAHQRIGSSGAG